MVESEEWRKEGSFDGVVFFLDELQTLRLGRRDALTTRIRRYLFRPLLHFTTPSTLIPSDSQTEYITSSPWGQAKRHIFL